MSQFREIVESILQKENNINLNESITYSLKIDNSFLNNGLPIRLIVLKNPSKEELENFKNKCEYNCLRGFINRNNNDVYICDAYVGTHDTLRNALENANKISDVDNISDFLINSDDSIDGSDYAKKFLVQKYNLKNEKSQISALTLEWIWSAFYINNDNDEDDIEFIKNKLHLDPKIISYDNDKPNNQKDNFTAWYKKVKPYLNNNIN